MLMGGKCVGVAFVALAAFFLQLGSCTYRSIHISNADVCNRKTKFPSFQTAFQTDKELDVGEGAIIFQLANPSSALQKNIRDKREICEIQIEAPDDDYGIMAYVEVMHMRQSTKDGSCVDYLQFGRSDAIPFVTLRKSKRLCGEMNGKKRLSDGYGFVEPEGSLLVWIAFGGRRRTQYWPDISKVNLTLVVTAYKKTCSASEGDKFRSCDPFSKNRDCIRKDFFCDRHFNCPSKFTGSEGFARARTQDEEGCEEKDDDLEATGATPGDGDDDGGGGFTLRSLNLISWTLIIVCSTLAASLFVLVFCRARKLSRQRAATGSRGSVDSLEKCFCCCFSGNGGGAQRRDSCEFSEHQYPVRSVAELSNIRQQRHRGGGGARGGGDSDRQNLYLPLTVIESSQQRRPAVAAEGTAAASGPGRPSRGGGSSSRRGGGGTPSPSEEAPPAYHEIFPNGAPAAALSFLSNDVVTSNDVTAINNALVDDVTTNANDVATATSQRTSMTAANDSSAQRETAAASAAAASTTQLSSAAAVASSTNTAAVNSNNVRPPPTVTSSNANTNAAASFSSLLGNGGGLNSSSTQLMIQEDDEQEEEEEEDAETVGNDDGNNPTTMANSND